MKKLSIAVVAISLPLAGIAMGASPTMAKTITTLDTATLVPALSQSQTPDDVKAAKSIPSQAGVDPLTVRILGENQGARYSVALDATGQMVCVFTQLSGPKGVAGSSCVPKQQFAQSGVKVGVQENGGGGSVAYLLPGDVDATPLKARMAQDGLTGKNLANLVVQSGSGNVPQQMELSRRNSDVKFDFKALPLGFK